MEQLPKYKIKHLAKMKPKAVLELIWMYYTISSRIKLQQGDAEQLEHTIKYAKERYKNDAIDTVRKTSFKNSESNFQIYMRGVAGMLSHQYTVGLVFNAKRKVWVASWQHYTFSHKAQGRALYVMVVFAAQTEISAMQVLTGGI